MASVSFRFPLLYNLLRSCHTLGRLEETAAWRARLASEMDAVSSDPLSARDPQLSLLCASVSATLAGGGDGSPELAMERVNREIELAQEAGEDVPHTDWARHAIRINDVIDNQVRSLRARQVIDSFDARIRKGTYWGIRTDIAAYGLANALPCPLTQTTALAETPTRLKELPDLTQQRLINWGYGVCDAGTRQHVATSAATPANFPYPGAAVGGLLVLFAKGRMSAAVSRKAAASSRQRCARACRPAHTL